MLSTAIACTQSAASISMYIESLNISIARCRFRLRVLGKVAILVVTTPFVVEAICLLSGSRLGTREFIAAMVAGLAFQCFFAILHYTFAARCVRLIRQSSGCMCAQCGYALGNKEGEWPCSECGLVQEAEKSRTEWQAVLRLAEKYWVLIEWAST